MQNFDVMLTDLLRQPGGFEMFCSELMRVFPQLPIARRFLARRWVADSHRSLIRMERNFSGNNLGSIRRNKSTGSANTSQVARFLPIDEISCLLKIPWDTRLWKRVIAMNIAMQLVATLVETSSDFVLVAANDCQSRKLCILNVIRSFIVSMCSIMNWIRSPATASLTLWRNKSRFPIINNNIRSERFVDVGKRFAFRLITNLLHEALLFTIRGTAAVSSTIINSN